MTPRTVGKRTHDLRDGTALYIVGAWLACLVVMFLVYVGIKWGVSGLAYALGWVR